MTKRDGKIEVQLHEAKSVAFALLRLMPDDGEAITSDVRESLGDLSLTLAGQLERLCQLADVKRRTEAGVGQREG